MGIFDGLRLARRTTTARAYLPATSLPGLSSPWSGPSDMRQIVLSDVLVDGERDAAPLDRDAAMTLPSFVKGRAVLVGALADRPLRVLDSDDTTLDPLEFFHDTGMQGVTTWHRMADTLEQLILNGSALWIVQRTDRDPAAKILSGTCLPAHLWRTTEDDGTIELDATGHGAWRPALAHEVVFFRGPQDGLLTIAAATIRGARAIERTWTGRASTPAPVMIVEEVDQGIGGERLTDDEVHDYLQTVAKARRDPDGALMFVPAGLKLRVEGQTETDLLNAGRNSVKLDMAAFLNLPSAALDATLEKSSLTYETADGKRGELRDLLTYWTGPIEARLSEDDICPPGTRVRFDLTTPTPATGTTTED